MNLSWLIAHGVWPPIWRRLAADTASLINGATAQAVLIYNTYTSDTVYERAMLRWGSNILEFGVEHVGGTLRSIRLRAQSFVLNIAGSDRLTFASSAVTTTSDGAYSLGGTANRFNNGFFAGYVRMQSTTVGGLTAAATAGAGARAQVTDALTPTFGAAVSAGGAVVVPVYSDGTIWRVG